MIEHKRLHLDFPDDAPPGSVRAIFSTFGIRDKQGDIVQKSAIEPLHGVEVPLIWSHKWDDLPVGKGTIVVEPKRAVLDGAFHLQTDGSRDTHATVKAMGALAEFSYGFDIAPDGFHIEDRDEGPTRIITKLHRIYEVSGVLVGAGENTGVLAIKSLADDVAALKAGRKLSAASLARIQAALDALTDLLGTQAAAEDADDGEGEKSGAPDEAKPLATHAGALAAELHAFRALAAAAPVAELRAAAEPLVALGYLLGDVQTQLAQRRRVATHGDAPDTAALYREFEALSRTLAPIVGEE